MTNKRKRNPNANSKNLQTFGLQERFNKLYEDSKKGKSFHKLFDLVIADENILLAYRNIRVNKGSRTPGVDDKTISDFDILPPEEIIKKVRNKLNNYIPNAVRRVEIPKPNGKMRPLGIPTMIDRLCQQAMLQVLEPICEARFYPYSYGFRPGYSAENAIADMQKNLQLVHCHYVVDIDIEGFFDNINHAKLKKQIWNIGIQDKKVIKIISQMLIAPIVFPDGTWIKPEKGTPQGGIISPLLANIVLNEFDWWVDSQWRSFPSKHNYFGKVKNSDRVNQGTKYRALRGTNRNPCNLKEVYLVRYADDFKLFCRNYSDARRMYHASKQWLEERLKLNISEEKSKITNCRKNYSEFLGFELKVIKKADKYVLTSHVKKKAVERCYQDLKKQLQWVKTPKNDKDQCLAIGIYNLKVRGIQNYYSIATECVQDFHKAGNDLRYQIDKVARKMKKNEDVPLQYKEYETYRKQLRLINDQIILPVSGFKHRNAMAKNRAEFKYSDRSNEFDIVLDYLVRTTSDCGNVKYYNFRISRWYAQKGKCSVLGISLSLGDLHCHHIIPKEYGGTDEYNNLVIIHQNVHHLIHATKKEVIEKYLKLLGNIDSKTMKKINKYRVLAGNAEI